QAHDPRYSMLDIGCSFPTQLQRITALLRHSFVIGGEAATKSFPNARAPESSSQSQRLPKARHRALSFASKMITRWIPATRHPPLWSELPAPLTRLRLRA